MTIYEIFNEMVLYNKLNGYTTKGSKTEIKARVVFSQDNFDVPYSEFERTYEFTSDNKAFYPNMCSNSIFANCLDGNDNNIRLDHYIIEWKIEKCFLVN